MTKLEAWLEKEKKWLDSYHGQHESRYQAIAVIEKLKAVLEKFSESVDESLLLDEELAQDWGKLRKEVETVNKILTSIDPEKL